MLVVEGDGCEEAATPRVSVAPDFRRRHVLRLASIGALVLVLAPPPAAAEAPIAEVAVGSERSDGAAVAGQSPVPFAAERAAIDEIRVEIESATSELRKLPAGPTVQARLDRLRDIERVTASALQTLGELALEPVRATDADLPDSASVGDLSAIYDALAEERSRIADLDLALQAAIESRSEAEKTRSTAQRDERRINKDTGAAAVEKLAARDRALLAAARFQLADLEEKLTRRTRAAHSEQIGILERRIAEIRSAIAQDGRPLDSSSFVDRGDALRNRLEAIERRRASLDLQVEAAGERYRRRSDAGPELLVKFEGLRAVRDLVAAEEAILRERIARLSGEEESWNRWHRVITGGTDADELARWIEESEQKRQILERERMRAQGNLASRRDQLESIEQRAGHEDAGAGDAATLKLRKQALEQAVAIARDEVAELDRAVRLETRLAADARDALGEVTMAERVSRIWHGVTAFFAIELSSIDDQPITVGKALSALLLLFAGVIASGRASRMFGSILARRGRVEPGVAGAVQTGSFYILLISFTLVALRLLNFPLTAFTVAGGALAIGIGFGSQNILNNFISGLIIMFERPIRSHDLVEIEGTHGTVEQVGLRSTRIRAQDGRHIVVPNSFFLESNVVNWTLSDELVRGMFAVGVIYGSDTRLVDRLIDRALRENDRVLAEPPPVILFANFGDNSLDFHVYFWTRSRTPMGLQQVMSSLRFAIDRLFREAGLVIAFPQRDVHLDTTSPIEIALVDRTRASGSAKDAKEREH